MFIKKIAAMFAAALFAISSFAAVEANKGTAADLDGLKGVGPALSKRIIDARAQGKFKDWPDFMQRVKGVKAKSATKLSAEGLTINGQAYAPASPAPARNAAGSVRKKTEGDTVPHLQQQPCPRQRRRQQPWLQRLPRPRPPHPRRRQRWRLRWSRQSRRRQRLRRANRDLHRPSVQAAFGRLFRARSLWAAGDCLNSDGATFAHKLAHPFTSLRAHTGEFMNPRFSLAIAGEISPSAAASMAQTKWDLPTAYPGQRTSTSPRTHRAVSRQDVGQGQRRQAEDHGGALQLPRCSKAPEIKRAVQGEQAQMGEITCW